MKIGAKVRQLRMQSKMTQKDVANECGFTTSLLSKIENDVVMPPIATLHKIATCLGVKLSTLLEDIPEEISASYMKNPLHEPERFVQTEKGYSILPVGSDYLEKDFQPMLVHCTKDDTMHKQMLYHAGEEFILILRGSMVFRVDGENYHLREGDSLYFNAQKVHGISLVDDEVFYLDVLSD